jgi:hypothetical protein
MSTLSECQVPSNIDCQDGKDADKAEGFVFKEISRLTARYVSRLKLVSDTWRAGHLHAKLT